LLLALVERRLDVPGEPVSMSELIEHGWPGERILPYAAENRVRVSLSELRRMGLRSVLLKRGEGWLLDPDVRARLLSSRELLETC
jgi:hypothetical protein